MSTKASKFYIIENSLGNEDQKFFKSYKNAREEYYRRVLRYDAPIMYKCKIEHIKGPEF